MGRRKRDDRREIVIHPLVAELKELARGRKYLALAYASDLSDSTICSVFNGVRRPSLETLSKLAKGLDCDVRLIKRGE